MKIGFIGAGHIGSNLARLFTEAGHQVAIGNSRGPETLDELVAELGDNATAVTTEEARDFGDVVVVTIPVGNYSELPSNGWEDKIVIDTGNYYPDRDGNFAELDSNEKTSSELLEKHLPGASVVKAFNTIWFEHLRTQGNTDLPLEKRRAIFIAGDDSEAKATVARLIEDIGFAAVDTGFLSKGGRLQQPDSPVYNKDITPVEAAEILAGNRTDTAAAS